MKRMLVGEFSDQSLQPVKPMIKVAADVTEDREQYFNTLFERNTNTAVNDQYENYLYY
ncbi:MAG: hypothetical protein MJ233_00105 [Mycoplasmoidaceae bacterium]|nr:hypothetical protein [Mycoplasmoidaceae bacterium]